MRKRRYPPGERKDRVAKVLEYIASNPGCRRLSIQAYVDSFYKSAVKTRLISDYLKDLVTTGAIEEKNGQFSITKTGSQILEFWKEKQT